MNIIEKACDADFTNSELKAGLIPTRALITDVKELAYLSEVDDVLIRAIEKAASGGSVVKDLT